MLIMSPVLLLLLAPAMARAGGTEAPEAQGPSAADRNMDRTYAPSAADRSMDRPYASSAAGDKSVSQGHSFALPQYQYTSAAGRELTRHMVPMAGPPGGFYRGQGQDKSSYRSSGFLTSKSAPSLALGLGYTPRTPSPSVQDPLQSRLGGFNLPQSAYQHRYFPPTGGLYQPVGGYGTKSPVGHSLPLIPPYHMRGSRVFDNISYKPRDPTKKTGVYVVPSPSKLYYDGVKQ